MTFAWEITEFCVTHLQPHQNVSYLQITIDAPFICFVFHAGIEGSTLPLCNIIAFRLCMGESMNSHHSFGLCLMFIAAVRPLTFLQALSSPCLMKSCSKSFWQEQNAVTFTVLSRRQQFCFILLQFWASDEVRKFFLCDVVWVSRGYVQEKFQIS
jgi:hypothetical protein